MATATQVVPGSEGIGADQKVVRAEVLRRVEALGNKVNLLVFRYLWPKNAKDKDDAWDGLVACCWRAKGNLLIPWRRDRDRIAATEEVICDELQRQLALHKKSEKRIIAGHALDNGFRWIARLVRNALADHIRSLCRGRRRRGRPAKPRVLPQDGRAFLQTLLRVQRARFVAALGEQWWDILVVLVDTVPLSETRRGWKSAVTRLIATHRGVSQQQARSDKRTMLLLADGEPVIEGAVREILAGAFVSRGKSANRSLNGGQTQAKPHPPAFRKETNVERTTASDRSLFILRTRSNRTPGHGRTKRSGPNRGERGRSAACALPCSQCPGVGRKG